jgi:hypothetical protein
MTTFADWSRGIIDAAEERGWAVIAIDARQGLVVLEEPIGSGGLTLRLSGKKLDADFIRQLPEASAWRSELGSPMADR